MLGIGYGLGSLGISLTAVYTLLRLYVHVRRDVCKLGISPRQCLQDAAMVAAFPFVWLIARAPVS